MNKVIAQSLVIPWGGDTKGSAVLSGPLNGNMSLGSILTSALPFIFVFAGVGLLLMLLAGGFSFLTSAGDAKKLEQGKAKITNALIGFFLIFASFWMVQALGYVFGVESFTSLFK